MIHSLPQFNLSFIYVTHATRALQSHDLLGEGINFGSHSPTYFFDHKRTWAVSPDEGSAQCRGLSETTQTTILIIHAPIHANKVNMKVWLWWSNDIRGSCGHKASRHLLYTWEKPQKNLTQETCPDRGSNSGPQRERHTCYRLLHSGGLISV